MNVLASSVVSGLALAALTAGVANAYTVKANLYNEFNVYGYSQTNCKGTRYVVRQGTQKSGLHSFRSPSPGRVVWSTGTQMRTYSNECVNIYVSWAKVYNF